MIISGICGDCREYFSGSVCSCRYGEKTKKDSVNFIADFHDDYYDHGLGEIVKSRQHRKQLMKEKKLEEVGNEWKYVDPERNRREIEKHAEQGFEEAKRDAMQMIGQMPTGRNIWN